MTKQSTKFKCIKEREKVNTHKQHGDMSMFSFYFHEYVYKYPLTVKKTLDTVMSVTCFPIMLN